MHDTSRRQQTFFKCLSCLSFLSASIVCRVLCFSFKVSNMSVISSSLSPIEPLSTPCRPKSGLKPIRPVSTPRLKSGLQPIRPVSTPSRPKCGLEPIRPVTPCRPKSGLKPIRPTKLLSTPVTPAQQTFGLVPIITVTAALEPFPDSPGL